MTSTTPAGRSFPFEKMGGLITDDRDVENKVYQKFSSFPHRFQKLWTTGWLT